MRPPLSLVVIFDFILPMLSYMFFGYKKTCLSFSFSISNRCLLNNCLSLLPMFSSNSIDLVGDLFNHQSPFILFSLVLQVV